MSAVGHDDDAARVHREVAWNPDQRLRLPRQLPPAGRKIELPKVGMRGEEPVERLLVVPGNAAGDFADLAVGAAVHLGHLAQRAAQAKGVVVRDHRRLGMGIVAEDVAQYLVALVPWKIEIDVGRVPALGIEEALEEESGAERLDVGDPETVAHHRVGHGAAAAVGGRVLDDVVHHEEVVGEALGPDDRELALQSLARHRCDGAVSPLGARIGERAEPLEGVAGIGEAGRHDPADRDPVLASLRDLGGRVDRLGAIGKGARDVGSGTEPGVARRETDGGIVGGGPLLERRQRGVEMNGAKKPVTRPVFRVRHDGGGGDGSGKAEPAGFREHRVALLARAGARRRGRAGRSGGGRARGRRCRTRGE